LVYNVVNEHMRTSLIAGTRCHSTLSPSLTNGFRHRTPKPAKPLRLRLTESVPYPRIGLRQSHFDYLHYFQQLNLEKGPFFSKRIVERSGNHGFSCNRYALACSMLHLGVTLQRRDTPAVEAGMWFGISSLPGKVLCRVRRAPKRVHPASTGLMSGYAEVPLMTRHDVPSTARSCPVMFEEPAPFYKRIGV